MSLRHPNQRSSRPFLTRQPSPTSWRGGRPGVDRRVDRRADRHALQCGRRLTSGLTVLCLAILSVLLTACGGSEPAQEAASETPADDGGAAVVVTPEPGSDANTQTQAATDETLVIFLGDSLTAGYGLDVEQSFPSLVDAALAEEGRAVRVVNAGISGDTTAGGLRRLDWLLRQEPDILVVALGGNDGLRGVDLEDSESNLRQIVRQGLDAGAQVLLAGMLIPPNYGPDYTDQFAELYPKLAEELAVPRIPFLLEGVAADPGLNLADGIHPNAAGQELVAVTVLEHLRPLLDAVASNTVSPDTDATEPGPEP